MADEAGVMPSLETPAPSSPPSASAAVADTEGVAFGVASSSDGEAGSQEARDGAGQTEPMVDSEEAAKLEENFREDGVSQAEERESNKVREKVFEKSEQRTETEPNDVEESAEDEGRELEEEEQEEDPNQPVTIHSLFRTRAYTNH